VLQKFSQLLHVQGFRRNLLTMLTGTGIAQALGLVFLPFLTRIYGPEAFGRFGMFYATICMLGVVATWRMELAIMLPKDEGEARQIWKTTLWILTGTTCLFGFILLVTMPYEKALETMSGVFLVGAAETFYLWYNRKQKYSILATRNVVERVAVTGLALAFASFGWLERGLIWAQLITLTVIVAYMLWASFPHAPIREHVTLKRMRELVSSYRDFPLVQGWSTLFVIGSAQLPNLFFGWGFSLEETGNVNLAYRIFEAPVNLFAISFSLTFYQHISHLPQSEISRLFRKSLSRLSLMLLPLFAAIAVLSPFVFPLVFGSQWDHAGDFAIPLSVVTLFRILYMSHNSALLVSRRLATDLKVCGAVLLAQFVGFYATSQLTHSPLAVVTAMSALSSLAFAWGLFAIDREVSRQNT
jgi:O-antigen/teichoic acid export membrane protein